MTEKQRELHGYDFAFRSLDELPTEISEKEQEDINKEFDDIVQRYSKKQESREITQQEREYYRIQREELEKMLGIPTQRRTAKRDTIKWK